MLGTKEDYGINWDNVNVIKNGSKSRTYSHKELIESKGFVWDRNLEAYIKPNSEYKKSDWYKRKLAEINADKHRYEGEM